MDKNKIAELENFIFSIKEKPGVAAEIMAGIIGVLIDLKPAMIGCLEKNEFNKMKTEEFGNLLDGLRLKKVYFERCYNLNGKKMVVEYFCISKKMRLAERTRRAFIKLWSTMNASGEILDREKWIKVTKKVGKLLGYPKTAIIDFVKGDDHGDRDRIERMKRNRYYVHSAEYEDSEFRLYDQKLNRVISNFAPKTTDLLTKNKEKRWLH